MKFLFKLMVLNPQFNRNLSETFTNYQILFIKDVFLNKENIINIQNEYDKYSKEESQFKDFYEELECIIFVYFILKTSFSKEIILNIIEDVQAPSSLNEKESFFYKLLVKKDILIGLIKDHRQIEGFFMKNEDNSKTNLFYNNLVISGKYKKGNNDFTHLIKQISECLFLEDIIKKLKKFAVTNIKINYKTTKKVMKNSFNKEDGSFKLVVYSYRFSSNTLYELEIFEFEDETIPNKIINIFKESPSMNIENFHKYLYVNKILYTHRTTCQTTEDLHPSINNILSNKNINDKFVLGNKIVFIKYKSSLKPPIKKNKENKDSNQKISDNKKKKEIMNFMKNYNKFLEYINSIN
jgi:hypothetical protein